MAARLRRRHGGLHSRGGRPGPGVPPQGRLPLGGRLLGLTSLGTLGARDRRGSSACRVPHLRRPTRSPDPPHAVRHRAGATGAVHSVLETERRGSVGAGRRQRRPVHERPGARSCSTRLSDATIWFESPRIRSAHSHFVRLGPLDGPTLELEAHQASEPGSPITRRVPGSCSSRTSTSPRWTLISVVQADFRGGQYTWKRAHFSTSSAGTSRARSSRATRAACLGSIALLRPRAATRPRHT